MGKIVWASPIILKFKYIVCPIEWLLGNSPPIWTPECTKALNALAYLIFEHLKLGITNKNDLFTLYIETNPSGKMAHAYLMQHHKEQAQPVAMIISKIQECRCKGGPVEIQLRLTIWATRSLSCYTIYPPSMYVATPDSAVSLLIIIWHIKNIHAMVIQLWMYNVQWIAGIQDFFGETLKPGLPLALVTWAHNKPIS